MKKTFRMRRVLTLSLASMMMLGGFHATPFGGVKVVKAQSQGNELDMIKTEIERSLLGNQSYTIESQAVNEEHDGRLKLIVTDSSKYEDKLTYRWFTRDEDDRVVGSAGESGNVDEKRKEFFKNQTEPVSTLWNTDLGQGFISIPFTDVNKSVIYVRYEGIDDIFVRNFEKEAIPVKDEDYTLTDTADGATIHGNYVGTLEIQAEGSKKWETVPESSSPKDLLSGKQVGESATWKVRKKTGVDKKKLPSLPVEIIVKKKEALTLEHLRALTFTLEGSNSLKVSGFGDVFTDYRIGKIKYKVGNSEAVEISSSQSSDLTIPNVANKTVKFYVGDNENQNFSIVVNQAEKPDVQTVKKKDEKTIIFGDEFHLFRYKKEGESAYKTPDKAEVTDLASGTYEVIKAGSDTKTHQFSTQGTSHTLTFDSEPLTIKLEAPSLPPIIYFPPVVDSSASEEKKTEEKKEEEKKETEKKAEEEKKEAEKKPETEQTESVVDEKKAESNTKIEKNTEAVPAVNKSVRNREKTVLSASVDMVKEVLKADKGNLNLIVKGGSIKLSHATLEAIFGFEAEKVSLNMKVSELKKTPANLTNRLASKKVYDVRVKVGKETINDYDLQGNKFLVSLDVKLAKAKKYFVLNVKTGERISAKYRKGKLNFKTSEAGQFVIVK